MQLGLLRFIGRVSYQGQHRISLICIKPCVDSRTSGSAIGCGRVVIVKLDAFFPDVGPEIGHVSLYELVGLSTPVPAGKCIGKRI